ncbi:DUF4097 family beta strand repeat-containing protein [Shouchella shacheensis]|uniref:DUF4097 family beta strand repeat-containing protein n=1 Tax=Shouchella shacheensis TaxID=1649580 RepID=UPI0007405539|nr:DUF4097 domain-containing protein [Shouchella shacheensis]
MEERRMILKMIEDGKITAEEGLKLLEATNNRTQEEENSSRSEVSTEVKWEEGDSYRSKHREESVESQLSKLTGIFDSAIQKIKDVDLDFNFGPHVVMDHIYQHQGRPPKSLAISLENGSLTLVPWDESDVRVECQAKVYRVKNTDEARRRFFNESTFFVDDDKLCFETKVKSIKMEATMYVPRSHYEYIKVHTFNGKLKGESISCDTLEASTVNGPIETDGVIAKKASLETVNGKIVCEKGQIQVLDAKTFTGEISVMGPVQDADIETVNGNISFAIDALTEPGYVDVKAATGSVELLVSKDIRVEGKLKTNVGSLVNKLTDSEVVNEKKEMAQRFLQFIGNGEKSARVKLTAGTNTGTISVRDAT